MLLFFIANKSWLFDEIREDREDLGEELFSRKFNLFA
jgi:hypothetical protein